MQERERENLLVKKIVDDHCWYSLLTHSLTLDARKRGWEEMLKDVE